MSTKNNHLQIPILYLLCTFSPVNTQLTHGRKCYNIGIRFCESQNKRLQMSHLRRKLNRNSKTLLKSFRPFACLCSQIFSPENLALDQLKNRKVSDSFFPFSLLFTMISFICTSFIFFPCITIVVCSESG